MFDFVKGTTIGSWKVNEVLGRGGQGTVWTVKPVGVKHAPPRALKVCFATEDQPRARFAREIELLQRCASVHVLKVLDHNLSWTEHVPGAPPFAYYVSEKCKGSLEDRRKDLGDVRSRLALFRQACLAVMHLHAMEEPVIHRDIKPANFLIAQELNNVVLADFGIARQLSESGLTQAFEVIGTQYYRAPEVMHGEPGTVRSDVYCMGRVLEWLLTGEVSTDMGARPVPRGVDLDDDACDLLDRVIARATGATAAHRFASVKEMADQLPELWLSCRPRPTIAVVAAATDAASVLPVALELARKNDILGWRQLENRLRRELVHGLAKWRAEHEPAWGHDRDKEAAFAATDKLVDVASGRLVLPLAGIFSSNAALADQRRIVDDFTSVPDWAQGGRTVVVEGPRALLFVTHYLHGALCLGYGEVDLALELADMQVPSKHGDEGSTLAIWQWGDLTGYPKTLGGTCSWAWEYLLGLPERQPALGELFAIKRDFEIGLASYSMLLSILELATIAANASPADLSNPKIMGLYMPPLFVAMESETVLAAAQRTSGNAGVVKKVADRAGAPVSAMRTLWPTWKKAQTEFRRSVFDRWNYRDGLPVGDLG